MHRIAKRIGRGRRFISLLSIAAAGMLVSLAAQAQDLVCGPQVKEEIAKALAGFYDASAGQPSEEKRLAFEADLYAKYRYCASSVGTSAPKAPPKTGLAVTDPIYAAARQCGANVSYLGSTYFEEMSCCGYDPQRRQFACPVKIKQVVGFGAAPLPGSREYVLNCVASPAGAFAPVGVDSVHLANALGGQQPSWQFAVVAAANQNLPLVQPMNGVARKARSILSWALQPTDCNYRPIWGVVLDYVIRLDQ